MNGTFLQKCGYKKVRLIKAVVSLLLCLCLTFLSSCSLITRVIMLQSLKQQGYKTEFNIRANVVDEYNEQTEVTVDGLLDQIEAYVIKNDSSDGEALVEAYLQLEEVFYTLSDHCDLLYIEFCLDPKDEEISLEYERVSGVLTDFYARINGLYDDIYDSVHGDVFFEEWSVEDIEEALYLSKTYTEEFAGITKERDKYIQLYEQLGQGSIGFKKKSVEFYEQIVAKNRELAALAGASGYPEYADRYIYGRDYSEEEIRSFSDAVKEYIVPLGEELMERLSSFSTSYTLQNEFDALSSYDISFSLMKERLAPYYALLGEDFETEFDAFDDRVFTAKNGQSLPVAFTAYQTSEGAPLCYFGEGYQTLSTYVHEQGHYLAFCLSNASISSVDLCETHSQSNEWLYLSYAEKLYDADLYKDLTAYYLLNQVLTITLSTCCDTFERAVYADKTLKAEDYDGLFIDCVKELGAYDFLYGYMGSNLENYWHLAVISNSMYYLSYAVSLIPSIEFYTIAEEQGFEYASALYYDLCTVEGDAAFHETIVESGLSSPFEKDVFKRIYAYFSYK